MLAAVAARQPLWANPTDGAVVAGGAIIQSAGNTTMIQQSTDRAVIHWQGFSIAPGETTAFVQPSASAAVLNRVTSGDSSQILGNLQANGQVYLLNPNGIYVGPGATVNVNSFLATTHQMDEEGFMRGADQALAGVSAAGIHNAGTIRAEGGDVYLVARNVENSGTIEAPEGTVGLMAGTKFYLQGGGHGTPAVRVDAVPNPEGGRDGTGVENTGVIRAVQARLEAAGNLYALAVSQRGIVQATGVTTKPDGTVVLGAPGGTVEQAGRVTAMDAGGDGGEIVVRAGEVTMDPEAVMTAAGAEGGRVTVEAEGTAWVSGQVNAAGTAGRGGGVTVTAARVGLRQAEVEVSGETGGGTVLLGGDFQGKNPAVRNAERAFVSADSMIRADAVTEGDGGKVITWSDHGTLFYGEVSARGGAAGGDGGLVEVSGRDYLDFQGLVDTRAPMGEAGTLWLDPLDLTILDIPSNNPLPDPGMNSASSPFAPIATGAQLSWASIQAQLAGGNVMVTTVGTPAADNNDGTIFVRDSFTLNSAFNLTLQAGGAMVVGNPAQSIPVPMPVETPDQIIFQGGGSLILQAVDNITFNADLQIDDGGNLTAISTGGNISDLSPPQENPSPPPLEKQFFPGVVTVTGNTYLNGQAITLNNSTHSLQGEIHASGQSLNLRNAGSVKFGNVTLTEVLTVNAGGAITQALGSAVVAPVAFLEGSNITLGSLANDFGSLGFPLANGNVTLGDQNSLQFSTTTITGFLDLTLGGNLTQSGVMNVQGNVTINAGGDIYLPLAGIPGNELAWGGGNTVTIERARDVFLGVQNELRLDVATADNSNPSIRNLTLRLREVTFTDSFAITGVASFAGTTDFAQIFIGDFAVPPLSLAPTDLQVSQANLDALTSAREVRFGAHTYTAGTGAITAITQEGDLWVADGTEVGFSTQMLAGYGGFNTEGTLTIGSPTSNNFTVVADAMSFGGIVTVDNGIVTLRPLSPGLTIGFNSGVIPVDLDLSSADSNITEASSLILGSLTQAAPFIVGAGTSFSVPVTFQTGSGVGEVQLYGNLTTSGSGNDLTIRGNLSPRDTAVVTSSGALTITGRIDGAEELDLTASGAVTLGGAVGSLTPLQTLDISGSTITLNGGAVTTAGHQTYTGAVTLGADTVLTGTTITFGGTVNDAGATSDETLTITGNAVFNGVVGGTRPLEALTVSGTTTINTTGITTSDARGGTGNQIYTGLVTLGVNTTLTGTTPTFTAGVTAPVPNLNLTLNFSGTTAINGATFTGINQLNSGGGGTTQLTGALSTTGSQTYGDNVTLMTDVTLAGTTITFNGTLNDDGTSSDETLSITGNAAFNGLVGNSQALEALSISGTTSIGTAAITTAGNQTYTGLVTLGANTTLTGATPTFGAGVDGNSFDLTLNFSGITLINGSFQDIDDLITGAGGTTHLTGNIATAPNNPDLVSSQTFNNPVVLLSDTVLTADLINFNNTVNGGGFDLTLNFRGTTPIFGPNFTNLDVLTTGSSGTTALSGSLTTSGAQIYGNLVELGGNTVLTTTGDPVSFGKIIYSLLPYALTVSTGGAAVTFGGQVGFTATLLPDVVLTPLAALTVTGSTIAINGGAVTTSGNQTYTGAVTLGADTVLETANGNVSFSATVQNAAARALTINAGTGTVTLGGAVGGGPIALKSLALTGGTLAINGGAVTTVETQTYTGPVVLGNNTILTGTTGTFSSTVNAGGFDLTLNFSGATVIDGAAYSNLGSLTTGSGGTTQLTGAISTTGGQSYNEAVTLTGATVLTTGGGAVTFGSTLDGAQTLAVNAGAGAVTLGQAVGATTALTSLALTGGAIAINGGAVTTSGNQTYTGPVTLGGATVLTATAGGVSFGSSLTATGTLAVTTTGNQVYTGPVTLGGATTLASSAGALTFSAAVNGAQTLSATAGAGTVTFGGAVGNLQALSSLAVTGSTIAINGGGVTTTGGQTYTGAVVLGNNAVLTGTTGSFSSTVNGGGFGLTLNFSGVTTISGGTYSNLGSLTTGGGGTTQLAGTITTTGNQVYNEAVTLTGATVLTTGGGAVTFGSTLNGAQSLAVNAGAGAVTLGQAVGGTTPLTSLAVTGSTIAIQGGAVTTTGNQTYTGVLTLTGGTALTANSGSVTFNSAVNGTGSLAVTGSTIAINGGGVTTVGGQTYTGAVVLGNNAVLTGTTGSFSSTVNGGGFGLTLNFSGVTTISGGTYSNLGSLTTGGGGTTQLAGTITTTGGQSYNEAVTLTGATVLTTGGGAVTFGSTLNGAQTLTVNAGAGAVTLGQAVGGTTPLTSLAVTGSTIAIQGGAVTTTGNQTYTGTVTSLGGLTLTTPGGVSLGSLAAAGAVTIQSGGRVALTGSTYAAAPLTITASSLANLTGVAAPFVNGGVTILTDRPNNNSPSSLNAGFSDLGYSFLPAPQVNFAGAKGTIVYRFFDAPGVATELQYVETGQLFAYTAAVPVTGFSGPRAYGGEVVLGPVESMMQLQVPGQVLPARPSPPVGSGLGAPSLGWVLPAETETGKGQAGVLRPRAGWVEPESLADRPVPGVKVSQLGLDE